MEGALHALALLLVAGAGAKLLRPERSVQALRLARLPASPLLARLLALGEIAVAGLVLALGGPAPALALAAVHLGFALFVSRLRAVAGSAAPCGCFGAGEATADHLVVNLIAAAVAALGALIGAPSLLRTLGDQPVFGLPYLLLVVVAVQATLLVLTALPQLLAASRAVPGT